MKVALLFLAVLGQSGFSQSVNGYWQQIQDWGTFQLIDQIKIDSAAHEYEDRFVSINSQGKIYHQVFGFCQATKTYVYLRDDSTFTLDSIQNYWQKSTIGDPSVTREIISISDTTLVLKAGDSLLTLTRLSGFSLPDIRVNPFPNGIRIVQKRAGIKSGLRAYWINGRALWEPMGRDDRQPPHLFYWK